MRFRMESSVLSRVLALCLSSTYFASTAIRRILSSGQLGIVDKGTDDLQTEADRFAQKTIVSRLLHHFPTLKVIGEEGDLQGDAQNEAISNDAHAEELEREVLAKKCPEQFHKARLEDMVVWVDPLDGTKEFTQGLLDHVTVLVGVAVGGKAVAGVISQPYYNFQDKGSEPGRIIWGIDGLGVFGLSPKPPTDRLVVTTSRSHGTSVVDMAVNSLEPAEVLRVGGSGHKVLLLLEGIASAYVFASKGTKKWDTCAPEAILNALGGRLTDLLGNELPYDAAARHGNNEGLFATARAADHAKWISKLPEEVLSQFRK